MKSLKVAINARTLADKTPRGWSRYTINLLRALSAHPVHFLLMTDRPLNSHFLDQLPSGTFEVCHAPSTPYLYWEQSVLPRLCQKFRADLLHCPINYGLPILSPCPKVLTLHDAILEVFYQKQLSTKEKIHPSALKVKFINWASRRFADAVITVSNHAKSDLISHLHLPEHKITVIYEAADPIFLTQPSPAHITSTLARLGVKRPFLFYIGGLEKRKNVRFLIDAHCKAKTNSQLVIGGGKPEEIAVLTSEYASSLDKLQFLGWVGDADLSSLYAGAQALVYPSLYEGFGLQICEALAMGCPVLVSDRASLPEIAGQGGITFPLDKDSTLIRLIEKISTDADFQEELAKRAIVRAKAFSWEITAQKTWQVYQNVCR